MDRNTPIPIVPLHLTSLAILSPSNAPLYVRSFTGPQDELRHYHLAHSAVDVIEERIVMTTTPNKPADSYLGLLFCMEDMAFYGFQTQTKIRMVLSIALVDAMIKDADIIAIFRCIHHLLLEAVNNPFLSLPSTFRAIPSSTPNPTSTATPSDPSQKTDSATPIVRNEVISQDKMFGTGPEDIRPEWLVESRTFQRGIQRIGELLNGGRT